MEHLTAMAQEKVMAVVNALPAVIVAKGMGRPGKTEFTIIPVEITPRLTVKLALAVDYDDSGLPYEADVRVSGYADAVKLRAWGAAEIELATGTERVEFEFGGVQYVTDNVMFHALDTAANDPYYRTRPAVYHRAFAFGITSGRITERN